MRTRSKDARSSLGCASSTRAQGLLEEVSSKQRALLVLLAMGCRVPVAGSLLLQRAPLFAVNHLHCQ
jgi:hypothetical protein